MPSAPSLIVERCNPYGFGTDKGAKHLMGGLYGPEHVGPVKWHCRERVDGRFRMTCICEHVGQPMPLCSGHRLMIAKRQSGVCPPCVCPPRARELYEAHARAAAAMPGLVEPAHVIAVQQRMEAATVALMELTCPGCIPNSLVRCDPVTWHKPGLIHRCKLTLTEVS